MCPWSNHEKYAADLYVANMGGSVVKSFVFVPSFNPDYDGGWDVFFAITMAARRAFVRYGNPVYVYSSNVVPQPSNQKLHFISKQTKLRINSTGPEQLYHKVAGGTPPYKFDLSYRDPSSYGETASTLHIAPLNETSGTVTVDGELCAAKSGEYVELRNKYTYNEYEKIRHERRRLPCS